MASQTSLVSFVLRFVLDEPAPHESSGALPRWHGMIRHVQTNEELHFARWDDVVSFIEQYVNLSEPPSSEAPEEDGARRP